MAQYDNILGGPWRVEVPLMSFDAASAYLVGDLEGHWNYWLDMTAQGGPRCVFFFDNIKTATAFKLRFG